MRLELHDAALSQEWQEKQRAAAAEEEAGGVQRSGLSGRLRGALSSLSGSKVPSSRIPSAGVQHGRPVEAFSEYGNHFHSSDECQYSN